ncbi:hypothetical protein CCACVL1_24299 [Corchorus capsularis]|uniref:Uncharacterized protein n=1 Tax=Corchorus capsularis TaxID=210143 RepID=A0A1R3GQC9_COCAP|nr:hypothetical protein CCACVL1_24299 [Corchorus capsularis]
MVEGEGAREGPENIEMTQRLGRSGHGCTRQHKLN